MNTDTFASRWTEKKRQLELDDYIEEPMMRFDGNLPGLDSDSRKLLRESGLPKSAPLFLNFEQTSTMPRIYAVFNCSWSKEMKALLEPYRMIGSDGEGSPICVDEISGEVWLFDHEAKFLARQFMNSSIAQLAECLLSYDYDKENDCPTANQDVVRNIDARALEGTAFWRLEYDPQPVYWAEKWAEDPDRSHRGGIASLIRRLFHL